MTLFASKAEKRRQHTNITDNNRMMKIKRRNNERNLETMCGLAVRTFLSRTTLRKLR